MPRNETHTEWLITCKGHSVEVKQHLENGLVPERTISGLKPALSTYFWLYQKDKQECHLYLDLDTDDQLSRNYFSKRYTGNNLLIKAQTEVMSYVTGSAAND